ncbi:MAG TPA: hypothetical protein VMZ71_17500 [Gemmataceae bacterium]|nr:hypothetical protein [Gemmataceae bacterium]
MRCLSVMAFAVAVGIPASADPPTPHTPSKGLPTPREMAAAREDVWGEAAIRSPGGPSYEFFRDLLPPLRYVNAAFKHFPIVLSAPSAPVKARWVGNGSGINLRADKPPMWKEAGTPVAFLVGETGEAFGAAVERLDGPRYPYGAHLPVVGVRYTHAGAVYEQEAFAGVQSDVYDHGAVYVRFTLRKKAGRVTARVGGKEAYTAADGFLKDEKNRAVVRFSEGWMWNERNKTLTAELKADTSADLVVFTRPLDDVPKDLMGYVTASGVCAKAWSIFLATGCVFEIPERVVDDARDALIAGNYAIAVGDRMHYSAGNAYDHLYEAECGDAVRSMMLFGHTSRPALATDAKRMIGPLLDFDRKATRFHVAGHKLQLLAHYYWVTRDKAYLAESRAKWERVVAFVRENRKTDNGLLPKDNYAGDVNTQVYSLNSNAACWRGLRDVAAVLDDLGEKERAGELRAEAAEYRKAILDAVAKSVRAKEKFVPVALLADEPAHDPLTATRQGSYYDLIIPYILGSGVFGPRDEREGWIIDYLRTRGGLAMGMIRSTPHQGEFDKQPGVNPLYGLRYNLTLLRRGDRDHALVGFYGHLAQGMTRDTFVGGEGSRFFHGDEHGRSFYLPPNSASNATFLTTLRYLLVQDWDLDDDGTPDTLRLCDAIPPRWLRDGKPLVVENAPSAFGEVSFRVESRAARGEVVVDVQTPPRPVSRWTLRLPDPPGYTITGVKVGTDELKRDTDGRVDLTGREGKFRVVYFVKPVR